MDTERVAEFVSTLVILAGILFVAVGQFGVTDLQTRLAYAAAITVVPFAPIVYYVVFVGGLETYMIGPWGPEDVVFLAVATPGIAGVVWGADAFLADSPLYWIVVVPGLLVAILAGVVVRSLVIGEWPPGSTTVRQPESGPPGSE